MLSARSLRAPIAADIFCLNERWICKVVDHQLRSRWAVLATHTYPKACSGSAIAPPAIPRHSPVCRDRTGIWRPSNVTYLERCISPSARLGANPAYGCDGPTVARSLPFSGEYIPKDTPFAVAFRLVYVCAGLNGKLGRDGTRDERTYTQCLFAIEAEPLCDHHRPCKHYRRPIDDYVAIVQQLWRPALRPQGLGPGIVLT